MTRYFSYSTLMVAALKELRILSGNPQWMIASRTGKTPNAYGKIENGHTELTLEAFFAICGALEVNPSAALARIEAHSQWLISQGWRVKTLKTQTNDLEPFVTMYFMDENQEALTKIAGIEANRIYLTRWSLNYQIPCVLRFATEPKYRQAIDTFKEQYQ
jgi:transcriptional regulator with XRE-family HTH domain